MRQRARELGALPSGLVKPGQVFEWHTLEPWADPVDDDEIEEPAAEPEGHDAPTVSVRAGSSKEFVPDRPRRGRPPKAAVSDDVI